MEDISKFILIVKGENDKIIVESILKAARIPLNLVNIKIAKGEKNIKSIIKEISFNSKIGMLTDLNIVNLPNAEKQAKQKANNYEVIEIFFAVPEIEAWLFADDVLAIEHGKSEHAKNILRRMSLPDEIPYPKQSASNLFEDYKTPYFLEKINISKATARSASLRNFLHRISEITEIDIEGIEDSISKNLDRRIFINLLNELLPSEKIVFKASNGQVYNVESMIQQIKNETEIGQEYTSDLLRIVRDLLMRKANAK